jgi:BlaI family transcriptional regulator, penicillinase repressor
MSSSKRPSQPTESELEILQVLWRLGPQSVRQVWEALGQKGGYTTVLKMLQIMFEKGLVRRDDSRQTHIYEAVAAEAETQERIAGNLMDRVFGGSASRLLLRALSAKPASAEELRAIRELLDQAQKQAESGKDQP